MDKGDVPGLVRVPVVENNIDCRYHSNHLLNLLALPCYPDSIRCDVSLAISLICLREFIRVARRVLRSQALNWINFQSLPRANSSVSYEDPFLHVLFRDLG